MSKNKLNEWREKSTLDIPGYISLIMSWISMFQKNTIVYLDCSNDS